MTLGACTMNLANVTNFCGKTEACCAVDDANVLELRLSVGFEFSSFKPLSHFFFRCKKNFEIESDVFWPFLAFCASLPDFVKKMWHLNRQQLSPSGLFVMCWQLNLDSETKTHTKAHTKRCPVGQMFAAFNIT